MSVDKGGEEVTEEEYRKEIQVVKKLCLGNVEAYLNWKIQLDHILKTRPYESAKSKLDKAEAMLNGDLLKSWKLWYKNK